MSDSANAPKPSSSVKLVLLGEAAVGKVGIICHSAAVSVGYSTNHAVCSLLSYCALSTMTFKKTRNPLSVVCSLLFPCVG